MTLKQTLIRNSLWIYSTDIIGKVLSYFLIVAIARNLGEVGLGEYTFIFAFASFSLLCSEFGMAYFLTKEIAKDHAKANEYFPTIISIRIIFSIIGLIAFILISQYLGKSAQVTIGLTIALFAYMITSIAEPYVTLLQAHNKIKHIAIANLLEKAITVSAGLYVLLVYKSLILLIAVSFISNFLRQIILFAYGKKFVTFRLDLDPRNWKIVILASTPYWLMGILTVIYFRTDTIMISLMAGDQATGIYNAAYKLTEAILFIPNLLLFVIIPSISYLFKHDTSALKMLFQRAVKYILHISIPMTIGTVLLADRFISFIYTDKFVASAGVLQLLMIAIFFSFMNTLFANLLTATDRQTYTLKISMALALLNIVLNFILIPKYSFNGAAIATLITQALNFLMVNHYTSRFMIRIDYLKIAWKPLVASLMMAVFLLRYDAIAIWYLVPLAAVVYFSTILLLGVDEEDKTVLKEILR